MFKSPEQLMEFLKDVEYVEFSQLMPPIAVLLDVQGSCHDQALMEFVELSEQGYDVKAKFIIAVDKFGQGQETHSFVYYKDNDKWCWIENAWSDLRGIRYYTSEQELIDSVMFAFGQRNTFDKLYIADFNPSEHTIGEDLETFVDICMNSAEEYQIS